MAGWPGIVDYETAIQNPDKFFQTPDLQKAKFEKFPNGTNVLTGNFAAVYKAILPSGVTTLTPGAYALRVFHREPIAGMQDRYEAISKYLSRFQTPYFVDYNYFNDEVLAKGARRPVILMKWIKGISFGQYIAKYYKDKDAMLYIASSFMGSIVAGLRGLKMSHGDLQDGNVIIDDQSNIILVDYDDIYAPVIPLVGGASNGVGKPEFNHPKRPKSFFGPETDNFAALVIYLSLGALAEKPELFDKYNNNDNIIFKKDDYLDPKGTPAWTDVLALKNSVVHDLTLMLSDACKLGPDELDKVPNLVDAINDIGQALPAGKKPVTTVQPIPATPKPTPPQPQPTTQPVPTPTATAQPQPILAPSIVLPTTSLTFGATRVGQSAIPETFEIQNLGTADLQLQSVGSTNPAFTVAPLTSNTVTAGGPPLVVSVEFHPTARGPQTVSVEIRSNDPQHGVMTVNLSGRGVAPEMAISWPSSPAPIDFGQVKQGLTSSQKFSIQNTGDADLGSIAVSGPAEISFSVYSATLVPGASQEIEATYTPGSVGSFSDQIKVESDDASHSPTFIAVTGEGVSPVTVYPAKFRVNTLTQISLDMVQPLGSPVISVLCDNPRVAVGRLKFPSATQLTGYLNVLLRARTGPTTLKVLDSGVEKGRVQIEIEN